MRLEREEEEDEEDEEDESEEDPVAVDLRDESTTGSLEG